MRDLVTGGQVTMHGLRMLMQVLHKLFMIAVFGFIGISIYWFFETSAEYDRHMMRTWFESEIKVAIHGEGSPKLYNAMIKYRKKYFLDKAHEKYRYADVETSVVEFQRYCHKGYKEYLKQIFYDSIRAGVIGAIGLVVLMLLFFQRKGITERIRKFIRGGQITDEKELVSHIKRMNRKAGCRKSYNIYNIPYPFKSEQQGTLVIGSTGQGKTQLISDLVEQIRKRGERVVIYDKKGDYLSWFYDRRKDYILNPFDKRSENWNILKEVDHEGMIKTLAESFIPNRGERAGESKIWEDAARLAFREIVKRIMRDNKECNNEELLEIMLHKDLDELAEYVKQTDAQGIINTDSKKTAMSVVFVLASHFNSLRLSKGKVSDSFSIREWMSGDDGDSALFITSQAKYESELSALQTAWFEIVINSILSGEQDSKKKTWVIIDELASLKKIPSLHIGLSAARSYGGCFVLGLQNISQLKDLYGVHNAGSISAECNTRCIFKSNDPETAKWASNNIGDEEIVESSKSLSYGAHEVRDGVSVTRNIKVRPLAMASEIQNMERLQFYLKMVDSPVIKKKIKYKDRKIVEKNSFIDANLKIRKDDEGEEKQEKQDIQINDNYSSEHERNSSVSISENREIDNQEISEDQSVASNKEEEIFRGNSKRDEEEEYSID